MRLTTRFMATLTVVFLTVMAGFAQTGKTSEPRIDHANIRAFLEVTGFDVALDSIAFSAAHAPGILGRDTSEFGRDWTRVTQEVFDTALMREMATDLLSRALTPELLGHAAGFYASDLGQEIVAVENAAHAEQDSAAKRDNGARLLAEMRKGDGARLAVMERLIVAVDSAGQGARAWQEVIVRFLLAASYAGVLDFDVDESGLRAMMAQDEEALRADMAQAGLESAAFTYRAISTTNLMAYVTALEHPDMRAVYDVLNAVQFEIMANRFEVLAARMADLHPGQEL